MVKKIATLILLFSLLSYPCHAKYTYKEWRAHELKKLDSAIILTDYMYERVRFYQKFDNWYEGWKMVWHMYELLEKTEIK